jgi:hypothetical protein
MSFFNRLPDLLRNGNENGNEELEDFNQMLRSKNIFQQKPTLDFEIKGY